MNNKIENYFPFSNIRESQKEALNSIKENLIDNNKKFFVLDAETGVGKSAIAIAAAKFLNENLESDRKGAYFITTQLILQDQYENDFSKSENLRSIKSASNYFCSNKKLNCFESMQIEKLNDSGKKCFGSCVYKTKKEEFLQSNLSVTSFSYFLTDSQKVGKIKPRKVLIIDEAHNIVNELSKFVEITISEKFSKQILNSDFPEKLTQKACFDWIKQNYYLQSALKVKDIKNKLDILLKGDLSKLEELKKISLQLDNLEKHSNKIKDFINVYDEENWSFSIIESNEKFKKIEFKPIDVSKFAHSMLYSMADKIILMSATVISKDKFCESIGIENENCGYIKLSSPFPIENRPVVFSGVGKMSADSIDASLPFLVKAIKEILKSHSNEKGIIHAHNYKIAKYLTDNIKSSRLLTHDSLNRNSVLEEHKSSSKPTVLISPSMQEGVDLKDDLSRFQILCKIPFPYLGDKLVKKRMSKWKWWYDYETAKTIIQSIGRSIRNENDYATTYILDKDWIRFREKNISLLPDNLKNSL